MTKIKALREYDKVADYFMVESCSKKQGKNNKNYLDISFKDSTGKIGGKVWNFDTDQSDGFKANDIVYLEGEVSTFNEKLQLTINNIRLKHPAEVVTLSDFVKNSPESGQSMYDRIYNTISEKVKNEELKRLTLAIYSDYHDRLIVYPAAISFHHAEIGGLLRHTLSIMRSVYVLQGVYPFLDIDLLLCGAALHDIGKIEENSQNELGLLNGHTVDGELFGHIVRGTMIIENYAKSMNLTDEKIMLLQHMILSHHGKYEFGSPVTPRFPEAVILHMADDMDAKMYEMEDAFSKVEPGELTEKLYAFDNIRLYRSKLFNLGEGFNE